MNGNGMVVMVITNYTFMVLSECLLLFLHQLVNSGQPPLLFSY